MRVRLTIECDMPPEYVFQLPRLNRHLKEALGDSDKFDQNGLGRIELVSLQMVGEGDSGSDSLEATPWN